MLKTERHKRLWEVLVFLIKLSILSVLLYSILWWGDLTWLQQFIASKVSVFFHILGFPVVQEGTMVLLGKLSFAITQDCTGWKGLIFFSALILAVKSNFYEKLRGLLINLPIIYSLNLLRVLGIIYFTYQFGSLAYVALHDLFWQFTMLFAVLVLWMRWLRGRKFIRKER